MKRSDGGTWKTLTARNPVLTARLNFDERLLGWPIGF